MENGSSLNEPPPSTIFSLTSQEKYKLPYSADYSDPNLGTVLHWHLSLCGRCDPERKVYRFGRRAEAFCPEYWEIVKEYADYEGHYGMMGNP